MIRHSYEVIETQLCDGDIDAVVVRINNTGDSGAAAADRYRHVIDHNLHREPVGCLIQWKDAACDVYVADQNTNNITVVFNAARAKVNLRIW